MTQPAQPTQQSTTNNSVAPKPTPPNPRIQAMDFALQLALVPKGLPITGTSVEQLISDAEAIFTFISKK